MLPIQFTKCPICHSKETISQIGCSDEPSVTKGTFTALEKVVTPIQQPTSMLAPLIRAIVVSYDVCAKCGHRYCTRAEKMNVPVQVQQFTPKSQRI
jgi:hypothetical protein